MIWGISLAKPHDQAYSDPYEVLGVARTAGAAELKQAYFALVRAHPPERDAAMFKRIRAAYEQLRDPATRAEADLQLLERWPAPTSQRRPPTLDPRVQPEDVIAAARALSDLYRNEWRVHFRKVEL